MIEHILFKITEEEEEEEDDESAALDAPPLGTGRIILVLYKSV